MIAKQPTQLIKVLSLVAEHPNCTVKELTALFAQKYPSAAAIVVRCYLDSYYGYVTNNSQSTSYYEQYWTPDGCAIPSSKSTAHPVYIEKCRKRNGNRWVQTYRITKLGLEKLALG